MACGFRIRRWLRLAMASAAAAAVTTAITDKIEAKRLVPSDRSWRLKNYYMLVEKQRHLASLSSASECPDEIESGCREDDTCCWPGVSSEWGDQEKEENDQKINSELENELIGLNFKKDLRRDQLEERINILGTLVKAGCLLASHPVDVLFQHEEEQRLVYSLAYDAYRYRSVFNQALQDTNFFMTFPQLLQETMLVHLLLCQLYRRRFSSREPPWPKEAISLQTLWQATGMARVEDALWEVRVRLAASLARLRIKSNALRLEQLLPTSLRNKPGVNQEDGEFNASSTAWINTFKISISEVTQLLESSGLKLRTSANESDVHTFWLDAKCPGLVRHHPALRADFALSQLVRDSYIILQGRAFCLGPGLLCRVLEQLSLTGSVVQTHASSPRTTAYLASLLANCSQPHSLITFGSGTRKAEFEAYLAQLGAVNVRVRAERFCEIAPDSALLDGVVAVLALPTNSNSAVQDPVELACSSGGDLSVLEELAVTAEGGCEAARARQELLQQEQHATLRLALAAPQIQVVLFESHSSALVETRELLLAEVESANNAARDRQASLSSHTRVCSGLQAEEQVDPPPTDRESTADSATHEQLSARSNTVITVPPTDLFEIAPVEPPSAELNDSREHVDDDGEEEEEVELCPALQEDGCYLALLKRQEITRLDAQYMIQIAESRGLFGGSSNKKKSPSASSRRTPRRNKAPDLKNILNKGKQQNKDRRCDGGGGGTVSEVERISAPTVASLLRQAVPNSISGGSSPISCVDCPKHARAIEPPPDLCSRYNFARKQDARRWWGEVVQRVLALGRIQNPAILPRFRLIRTPLPGPGASSRELYPLHIHQLKFNRNDLGDLDNIDEEHFNLEELYEEIQ